MFDIDGTRSTLLLAGRGTRDEGGNEAVVIGTESISRGGSAGTTVGAAFNWNPISRRRWRSIKQLAACGLKRNLQVAGSGLLDDHTLPINENFH